MLPVQSVWVGSWGHFFADFQVKFRQKLAENGGDWKILAEPTLSWLVSAKHYLVHAMDFRHRHVRLGMSCCCGHPSSIPTSLSLVLLKSMNSLPKRLPRFSISICLVGPTGHDHPLPKKKRILVYKKRVVHIYIYIYIHIDPLHVSPILNVAKTAVDFSKSQSRSVQKMPKNH